MPKAAFRYQFRRALFLRVNTDLTNAIEEVLEFRPDLMRTPDPLQPVPTEILPRRKVWNLQELLDLGVESKARNAAVRGCVVREFQTPERMGNSNEARRGHPF